MKARAAVLLVVTMLAGSVRGFTQSAVGEGLAFGIPMGHEWITLLAALEVLDGKEYEGDDPRREWKGPGKAKNASVSSAEAAAEVRRVTAEDQRIPDERRYNSKYKVVYDAIVGERWVDIGGFDITKSKFFDQVDCWNAVAQEAVEVQYDHFMRRFDDTGGDGGVKAMRESQARFRRYFVDAAMASPGRMLVYDGGATSEETEVDHNYFLFGRAVHVFQDSFSPEHTVRLAADNYETVREVKSYLCAYGSEQHSHKDPIAGDYSNLDVIWNSGSQVGKYKAANMRTVALVATEATKDLWAAFIRTMGTSRDRRREVAEREADQLIRNWLAGDAEKMKVWYQDETNRGATYVRAAWDRGKGVSVEQCMDGLGTKWQGDPYKKARKLEDEQRKCLYIIRPVAGYSDLFDRSMHMPYKWEWTRILGFSTPPDGWRIPDQAADTGIRYRIRSEANQQYLTASNGLADGSWLKTHATADPLVVTMVGEAERAFFRATFAPSLFVSYQAVYPGALKLYAGLREPPTADAEFAVRGNSWFNHKWQQYVWLYYDTPQLNRWGDPTKPEGRWIFERVP
jgi:hypothetical protein